MERISIPYGSIKAKKSKLFDMICTIFQFLMVRLKLSMGLTNFARDSVISIPYGSIKATLAAQTRLNFLVFQFLMVRLKQCEIKNGGDYYFLFQFLMVRLKP